jgi:hypothetical protein
MSAPKVGSKWDFGCKAGQNDFAPDHCSAPEGNYETRQVLDTTYAPRERGKRGMATNTCVSAEPKNLI